MNTRDLTWREANKNVRHTMNTPSRMGGFFIPSPAVLDSFVTFIRQELAPRKVNTLILRVDFGYQYKSHPELVDNNALSEAEVKKLVAACKQHGIRIIP